MEGSNQIFYKPAPQLLEVIDHYWFATVAKINDQVISNHFQIHLPVGCVDLYCHYKASKHTQVLNTKYSDSESCFLIGTRPNNNLVSFTNFSIPFFGFRVRFTLSGFLRIFGMPASELYNEIIPLEDLIGTAAKELIDKFENSEGECDIKNMLDYYFINRLKNEVINKLRYDNCAELLQLIKHYKGNLKLSEIFKQVNVSERCLEYNFKALTGLSPKEYCTNTRLNHVIHNINTSNQINWHDMVVEYGYYDQSHLINEFKKATTLTPEQFLKQKNKTVLCGNSIFIINSTFELENTYADMIDAHEAFYQNNN